MMKLAHTPTDNLPIRLGAPHKALTQEWWQSGVPQHRVEAWRDWGFKELANMQTQKTIEETYDGADEDQKRALIIVSEPLLQTHLNTAMQQDGSLKSPVAEMDVQNPTHVRIDTAIISKAPLKKKLVMTIKHNDLAGLDPASCLRVSKDGLNCEHPTALLSPFWQAAIEKTLQRYSEADTLKDLDDYRVRILKPFNQANYYSAKWKRWVLGDSKSLEPSPTPTHIVNHKNNTFRFFKKNSALRPNEMAIEADPLPPMTAALGPEHIPAMVWKTRQGSFLIESPVVGTGHIPVHPFEQQPVAERKAKSLMVMPKEGYESARIQLQLFDGELENVGWLPTKPGSFWMVVSPQTGAFAPLPSNGVRIVPCKSHKKFRQYKTTIPNVGGECVTGEDTDLFIVNNQDSIVLDKLKEGVAEVPIWEQIRLLCVDNISTRFLGFVSV